MQRKPWTELVDRNAFSRPANLTEVHLHAPGSVLYHLQRGNVSILSSQCGKSHLVVSATRVLP
jgi:hypothetical protein